MDIPKFNPGDILICLEKDSPFRHKKIRIESNSPWYYWSYHNGIYWTDRDKFNTSIDLLEEYFILDTPAAQVLYGHNGNI